MRQTSFLTLAHARKKLKCERFLDEMKIVVPWEQLTAIIAPYYKEQDTGRKRKNSSSCSKYTSFSNGMD